MGANGISPSPRLSTTTANRPVVAQGPRPASGKQVNRRNLTHGRLRLFFECVAATGGRGLTEPWLDTSATITDSLGLEMDADEIALGVAVTRGLLIDVLATGDAATATRSLERFVEMWQDRNNHPAPHAGTPCQ